MTTNNATFRYTMDGLLQYPRYLTAPEREWLARYDDGHECELWNVCGGADEMWGFTVLWVPAERVAWGFNCGLEATWYGNVDHPRDFETFFADPRKLTPIIHYVELSARCRHCRTRLTAEEREKAQIQAEVMGDVPFLQCDMCTDLSFYELL